jgi:hypothetical protein
MERQNALAMFTMAGGRVSPEALFVRPTLATPAASAQLVGTVHVHPNGRFVYVANRASETAIVEGRAVFAGGENTLAVYAIDPATGEPNLVQHMDTHGIHCRTFHIDPSGKLLIAAHIMGLELPDGSMLPARLSVFRIGTDGRLTFVRADPVDVGERHMWWMGMVTL